MVIFTTRGAKSGKIRKFALMRVEHDGAYALVGSDGGAERHPGWVHNLKAHPDELIVQDGPEPFRRSSAGAGGGGAGGLVAAGGRGLPALCRATSAGPIG